MCFLVAGQQFEWPIYELDMFLTAFISFTHFFSILLKGTERGSQDRSLNEGCV